MIIRHWPLVEKKCRPVSFADRADAIAACMKRLVKVWEKWKPELGSFGTFAAQALEWELQDFKRKLRQQVPVQRSININDPAIHASGDDDDDNQLGQPDMMRFNSINTELTEARRRLITEHLDCLRPRERQVIEALLGLNGYEHPLTQKALAADLDMDVRHIRRLEHIAVSKLQQNILPP